MKVLMINSVCGIRSTGRICTDLADILEKDGNECKIAYGRETVPEKYKKYAVRIGSDMDVNLHGAKARMLDASGFGSRKATEKFIMWVKEYDPDIIHLHNIHGYYINLEMLFNYLKVCGKKIVWTLHDCWSFTGHCTHFDYVGCEKWKTACSNCAQIREYPASLFLDNSKKNYQKKKTLFTGIPDMTIVAPSHWLAGLVKQSFLAEYPVEVINNGIDLSVFKPTPSEFREKNNLKNKKIILGVASVWNKRKGFDDFVRLSEMLDDSYRIVLVGLNEKQLKTIPKNILGIVRTNSTTELAEIYSAADVFVNPSVEEVMGLTTVEALACDTPVIVYNKTAVPEVVDASCGFVLAENTAELILKMLPMVTCAPFACVTKAESYEKSKKAQEYASLYKYTESHNE